jgi:hypothetical protein
MSFFPFSKSHVMSIPKADVVRHFLRLEASKAKYKEKKEAMLWWCSLPDEQLLKHARAFADERDDTNPVLAYTVGTTKADYSSRIVLWERYWINCTEIYTCGISPSMRPDIDAVAGNLREFAMRFAAKYAEFADRLPLPKGDEAVISTIAQKKHGRRGLYELVDGAHRLVALCRGGVETVEAYIGCLHSETRA